MSADDKSERNTLRETEENEPTKLHLSRRNILLVVAALTVASFVSAASIPAAQAQQPPAPAVSPAGNAAVDRTVLPH